MMKRIGWLFLAFNCFVSTVCFAQETVDFNNPKIFYMGRVPVSDTAAELSWTGASVIINFKGATVKATLNDEKGLNYYNVVIDGKVVNVLKPVQGKQEYTLASGLSKGKHQLHSYLSEPNTIGDVRGYFR